LNERIAKRAAQRAAVGVVNTRGARFAARWSGHASPQFDDMVAVPRWLMLSSDQQEQVAKAAGLMLHRAAIDAELSGPRLAMLAEVFGEELLDAVCAETAPKGNPVNGILPRPDLILADGWALLHQGLPAIFATRFPEAIGDPVARAKSQAAVDLVLRS
jgi:hypothetical protein